MGSSTNILLLDDDEANLLFFETILAQSDHDFQIFKSQTAAESEEIIVTEGIQFIISAWELRPVSGAAFIQRIKNDPQKKHLPLILYSKNIDDDDNLLIQECGIDKVINMPFDRGSVVQMIETMVNENQVISETEILLRQIEVLIYKSQYIDAHKLLDNDVLQHPDLQRLHTILAQLWLGLDDSEKAKQSIDLVLAKNAQDAPALCTLARWHSRKGEHDQAIEILETLKNKCSRNIHILLHLAHIFVEAKKYEQAEEHFKMVEEIDADLDDLKDQRGIMAITQGDVKLATNILNTSKRATPIAQTINAMGVARTNREDYDESISLYKDAIEALGNKTQTHLLHYNMALAYYKKGGLPQALENFANSYMADPSFERSYSALAQVARTLREQGVNIAPDLITQVKDQRAKHKQATL